MSESSGKNILCLFEKDVKDFLAKTSKRFSKFIRTLKKILLVDRGVTREGKGGTIPQVPNHCGGAESLRGGRITAGAPNHCGGRRKVPTMSQVLSSIE